MKLIINGKKYDTDTARKVGYWSNSYGRSDFKWCEETLYCKRTGEYFLYGEGGPMSRYAESCGDGWGSGSRIVPLTYEAARKWAEENLSVEEYEDEFGEVSEDDSRVTLSVSMSTARADAARKKAAETGISLSAYLESLIP